MLKRFSLYGFLKNQQYHEPFLVLAFLRMGLSFTLIGVLIGFREIVLNLFEIPSGAVADLVGRRRSLVFSMLAYIAGFVALGSAGLLYQAHVSRSWIMVLLFSGMMATAVGDAFRTGTHKAIIFSWLRLSGRLDERTRVYGFTRSFSKLGSAASVIIASVLVFVSQNYFYIFFLATIPYIINIVNILGYPAELEGGVPGRTSLALVASHMWQTFRRVARRRELRRLVFESMGFGGFFKAAGGYLQPILQAAAVPFTAALFTGVAMSSEQRSVILIGPVFVLLFVLSALASFRAHRLVSFLGHEENAARFLWLLSFLLLTVMAVSMYQGYITLVIAGFVLLSVLQNLWRPILVSRFDNHSSESSGATILSIESQGKSFATMLLAPLLGFLVDTVYGGSLGATPFWPVALIGAVLALLFFLTAPGPRQEQSDHGDMGV